MIDFPASSCPRMYRLHGGSDVGFKVDAMLRGKRLDLVDI